MATIQEVIDSVRDWSTTASQRVITDVQIAEIADELMKDFVRKYDAWFLHDIAASSNTTPGSWDMSFPTSTVVGGPLCRPVELYRTYTGSRVRLDYLHKEEFDSKYELQTAVTGDPIHYTIWNDVIRMGPTPTGASPILFDGYFYHESIFAALANENVFSVYATRWLKFAILEEIVKWKFEDDSRLGLFEAEARKSLHAILGETSNRINLTRRAVAQRR